MSQDMIDKINQMGEQEGIIDGIEFLDIHGKATLMDLYPASDYENYYDSCVSDIDYSDDESSNNSNCEDDQLDNEQLEDDKLSLLLEESEEPINKIQYPNGNNNNNMEDDSNSTNSGKDKESEESHEDDDEENSREEQQKKPRTQLEYKVKSGLDGEYWKHPLFAALSTVKSNEVNKAETMKELFQLEASKATPKYGF